MSGKQTITKALNVQAAETFVESLQKDVAHFVFAAKHTPFGAGSGGGSDSAPPEPLDNVSTVTQVYADMIFGKRIKNDNIANMIKRYEWKTNTVYDMYSDSDPELYNKQFYVVTDNLIELRVYKCLYNNNNAPSTVRPEGTNPKPIESLEDGYIWKYMYTINQFNIRKFATSDYVPVIPDDSITAAAINGSIEVMNIQDGGSGYDNYTTGNFPDVASIEVGGNKLRFALGSNASNEKDFYKDCVIKLIDGPGANEYRLITDYTIENGMKIITLNLEFNNSPIQNNEYQILPSVFLYNVRGNITSECVARAFINANTGNSVSRIEVLNTGAGYKQAAATIKTSGGVDVTGNCVIVPIMSPPGGHGSNVKNELFGNFVGITASFSGNNIPLTIDNKYRTIGIIRAPQYSSVDVKIDSSTRRGTFTRGEEVYRYKPIRLFGRVNVTANSTTVTGSNTTFVDTLRTNDRLIITNGIVNTIANIESIISDTTIVFDTPSRFTGANCEVYLVDGIRFGTVVSSNSSNIRLTNVDPVGIENSSYLLGENSYCTVSVNRDAAPYIFVSGRDADDFNGFNQLSYFVGQVTGDVSFIENELLYQGTDPLTRASAVVHSFRAGPELNKDRLYVTNITNVFDLEGNNTITGVESGETFEPTDKYDGELILESGEILYLENLNPVSRNLIQTETIKLIIEF